MYKVGEIVTFKKKHPCGSKQWEILKAGSDIKLKCKGCEHIIMLALNKFNNSLAK